MDYGITYDDITRSNVAPELRTSFLTSREMLLQKQERCHEESNVCEV